MFNLYLSRWNLAVLLAVRPVGNFSRGLVPEGQR